MDQALLTERVEYLWGQVTALQAAVRGLIAASPDPFEAERVVKHMLEQAQANGLASESATYSMLLGLERGAERVVTRR